MNIKINIKLDLSAPPLQQPKHLTPQEIQQIPVQMFNLTTQIQAYAAQITKNLPL